MAKFKFRLESVLKLRTMHEEKCRQELGILFQGLHQIEAQIAHDLSGIDQYYQIQEKVLSAGAQGDRISLFPMMVDGKKKNLKLLYRAKRDQEKLIEEKQKELTAKRADVKVMEKLKEKEFENFKHEYNTKMNKIEEEQVQLWLRNRKDSLTEI